MKLLHISRFTIDAIVILIGLPAHICIAATENYNPSLNSNSHRDPLVQRRTTTGTQSKLPWLNGNGDRTIDTIQKFENLDEFIDGEEDDDDEADYYGETDSAFWNNLNEEEEPMGNGSSLAMGPGALHVLSAETEPTETPDLVKATVTNCQCGFKRGNSGKIVGGTLAEENAWPWMAALVFVGDNTPRQFCGGSLINNLYLLTAAHCVQDINSTDLDNFRVYLGTNAIIGPNSTAVPFRLNSIIINPTFNKRTLNNDVALIKLAAPVVYNDTVMPVCLGQKGAPHSGRDATVAGWGSLSTTSFTVNNLRNVQVKVLPNGSCGTNYAKVKIRITQFMICASSPNKDSCKGDSGGPLFVKRNRNTAIYDQIGIVSFGQDCGKPEFPGVYARVGRFMKFIRDNTNDATYCTLSFSKP